MNLVTIDGIKYDPESIPQHVAQLFSAFTHVQKMQADLQSQLLVANHAHASLAAQIRGAMSVIPPYAEQDSGDVRED